MLGRERRSERGDDVGDTRLVHGDDVGVAFHDDGLTTRHDRAFRDVDAEHVRRLVKDGRLRGVEVLGLAGTHDAPAKRDAAPLQVMHRKHHAFEEAVDEAAALVHIGEVGADDFVTREAP